MLTRDEFLQFSDRFGAVVHDLPASGWPAASPCEGWSVADVLDHVVDSQRDFFSGRELDLGERPSGEPPERWDAHAGAVRGVLSDDLWSREYTSAFGRATAGATLSTYFGLDLVVHRWDIAHPAGVDLAFTDAELDHAEAVLDELGETIYTYGAAAPPVEPPADATRLERIIARTGRHPR